MNALRVAGVTVAWFVVFSVGLTVNSQETDSTLLGSLLYLTASTSTNVGILAILASLLADASPAKSIRRGLTIYLILLAGVLSVFPQTVSEPTQEQYTKLAGWLSLACVVVGYKPEVFDLFLDRIVAAVIGEPPKQPPVDG